MFRIFQYENEWNIIYYPSKPSGFSIMIIGDHHHFVNNSDSYWLQHPIRYGCIDKWMEQGYTCFSSNFKGKHWGNDAVVSFTQRFYNTVMRNEILNEKIHIFAEGKGALIALKLAFSMKAKIRSIVLLNPCLSIKDIWKQEKERKIFYKQFLNEMSNAYGKTKEEMRFLYKDMDRTRELISVPIKIIEIVDHKEKNKHLQIQQLRKRNRDQTKVVYLLPEQRYKISTETYRFIKRFENVL